MRFEKTDIPPSELIVSLRGFNLLPAIIFMPTRRKCDESATEVGLIAKVAKTKDKREETRREFVQEYIKNNPEIRGHKHRNLLIRGGIASHHAGHIPAWKLLVEKMMSAGLLDAIFATTTVAAGVDFPARTVVLSNADTRGNDGWRPLMASELQQMTGRAGRRGKDNVGFILLAPGPYQNPFRIARLLKSNAEPLQSQFRATYTSLLNLLDAYGSFAQVREIAEKSFAFRETARQITQIEQEKQAKEDEIQLQLFEIGLSLEDLRGFERLVSARMRLQEKLPMSRFERRFHWLDENVTAGRIVTQRKNKTLWLVLQRHGEKVSVMREDGHGTSLPLNKVEAIYAKRYKLDESSFELAFHEIYEGKNPLLEEPLLPPKEENEDDAVEILTDLITQIAPSKNAHEILWNLLEEADFLEKAERDVGSLSFQLWSPFEKKAKVLNHFGYLDFAAEKVSETGRWLADVRVDRPLLVGEALQNGFFSDFEVTHIVALMAALAADSDRNFGELPLDDEIVSLFSEFEEVIDKVTRQEWKFGVEPTPDLNFSAAATAARWAQGVEWEQLVMQTKAEEGDLVRLLSRTGEALMQIAALKNSQPEAAEKARLAMEIVLREPIR